MMEELFCIWSRCSLGDNFLEFYPLLMKGCPLFNVLMESTGLHTV